MQKIQKQNVSSKHASKTSNLAFSRIHQYRVFTFSKLVQCTLFIFHDSGKPLSENPKKHCVVKTCIENTNLTFSRIRESRNLAFSLCNFSVDIQRNKKLSKIPNQCRRIGYSKLGKVESPMKSCGRLRRRRSRHYDTLCIPNQAPIFFSSFWKTSCRKSKNRICHPNMHRKHQSHILANSRISHSHFATSLLIFREINS